MSDRDGANFPKLGSLLKLGAVFAAWGVALGAAGIATMAHALHGGFALGVLGVVIGLCCLGLGGYFAWGYGWLKRRPELVRKAQRNAVLDRDRLDR
jgi:hypothetical protein